ncbi:MAG: carboxypeptidase M32 [Spirochaetales bacterium]|nr:carboxypeptidase M32 [Spirochaetales bacterium]
MTHKEIIDEMKSLDADIIRLGHISALLEWDQETMMPSKAVEERAEQSALMVGLHHQHIVNPRWKELFSSWEALGENPSDETEEAFLREVKSRWEKKTRVPKELAKKMAAAASRSQAAWAEARMKNDFEAFAPSLEAMVQLQRQYALAIAPDADPYDTLLGEYEPGAKSDDVQKVFDELAQGLRGLMSKIQQGTAPNTDFLKQSFSTTQQDEFGRQVQEAMGYDYERGRLDLSAHPFTTTLGPDDVRVTTRYDAKLLLSGLFSNIHEAGHGLYEQGMGSLLRKTILADGASLGIHESQSRFWENMVGRSLAFWTHWFPKLQKLFPQELQSIQLKEFYDAVNEVCPSLIRVEADEVTYSFHIIARFRLEQALIRGELEVNDLPQAWNQAYKDLLGIDVPDDAQGCMQDVHWSVGLFGYFPTYALGNLYAAQFSSAMETELGSLQEILRQGSLQPILDWLRCNIHEPGRTDLPQTLCQKVTGHELSSTHFLEYLENKYAQIYHF